MSGAGRAVTCQTISKTIQASSVTPTTIVKRIVNMRDSIWEKDYAPLPKEAESRIPIHELSEFIDSLRREMKQSAADLEFERAADLRDRIAELEAERLRVG